MKHFPLYLLWQHQVKGAKSELNGFGLMWGIFLLRAWFLYVPSVKLEKRRVWGIYLCSRGFSIVPSVELKNK